MLICFFLQRPAPPDLFVSVCKLQRDRHLNPKVGVQQVVVVVSRVRGSAVLLIAGEAAKPSSIRVSSQTTVGLA